MLRTRRVAPAEFTHTHAEKSLEQHGKSSKQLPKASAGNNALENGLQLRRVNTRDSAVSITSVRLPVVNDGKTLVVTNRSIATTGGEEETPTTHVLASSHKSIEDVEGDITDEPTPRISSDSRAIARISSEENDQPPSDPNSAPSPLPSSPVGATPAPEPTDDQGILKAPIPWRSTNMQSAWTILNDEDFGTAQEWSHNPSEGPYGNGNTFNMELANPATGRWSRHFRVGPGTSSRRANRRGPSWRKACLLSTLGFLVTVVAVLIIVFTIRSHRRQKFDPQSGPRGQLPAPPPGPPLPVLNVLDIPSPTNTTAAGVYFGASIDWTKEDPQSFNQAFGHNAAIIDGYYMISETLERAAAVNSSGVIHTIPDYFNWTAGLIGGTGAIMGMTLMPHKGLENVTVDAMLQLGVKCAEINRVGIPVMLRFAPEMNGNWYPWGQNPSKFKEIFQQLAIIVRNATTALVPGSGNRTVARTAMVWAPAAAQGYPFLHGINGSYTVAVNGSQLFAMDTNRDGFVNSKDDPFTPYYPGDEYVDWIGITALFNTTVGRNATVASAMAVASNTIVVPAIANISLPTHPNSASNASFGAGPGQVTPVTSMPLLLTNFSNVLPPVGRDANGTSFESIVSGQPTQWSLYDFADTHKKPLLVGETGIGYLTGPGVPSLPTELSVKSAWWNQVYNETLFKAFPLIRAVVWYDYALPIANTSFTLDYSISHNQTIIRAFANSTNALPIGTLVYANETLVGGNTTLLGLTSSAADDTTHASAGTWTFANGTEFDGPLQQGTVVQGADGALIGTTQSQGNAETMRRRLVTGRRKRETVDIGAG